MLNSKYYHQKCKYVFIALFAILAAFYNINLNSNDSSEIKSESISFDCSRNGYIFDDINKCECYQCYSGLKCEIFDANCILYVGGGKPHLFAEFWNNKSLVNVGNNINILIEANYRTLYEDNLIGPFDETYEIGIAGTLNQIIRSNHKKYHNVNMTNKYLVFGIGASQLLTSFYSAMSAIREEKIVAFYQKPYFYLFPKRCQAATFYGCTFNSSQNSQNRQNIVEIITIPNNPDGKEESNHKPYYKDLQIYGTDLVYYWPHFYENESELKAINSPVSFFSLTKLSGHAATRFGWAFVEDYNIAITMKEYIQNSVLDIPIESMRRALFVHRYINVNGDRFFEFTRNRIKQRWKLFLEILRLSNSGNYILHSVVGKQYAWIKCISKNDTQIQAIFKQYGLNPRIGTQFGVSNHVRINILEFEKTFLEFLNRFKKLIVDENQ